MLQLPPPPPAAVVTYDVAVPMRDGVRLMADVHRPAGTRRAPVLVYRTPYGKHDVARDYTTITRAVARGYAVVVQDVRGRYASEGTFDAYRQEGRDGFDTIEWAAAQPWSSGAVGMFGLSYPAAVQWLAAVESPPHLKAIVPAMTFASPHRFFHAGGAWDLSWAAWTAINIMPDLRRRAGVEGPRTEREAREAWARDASRILDQRPLLGLRDFASLAPWYVEWMRREPTDPWWTWADLRGRYHRTTAAVLHWSGWHDEAYGPIGAVTNFTGLVAARRTWSDARTSLILGPWVHGVDATGEARAGARTFGPDAAVDYDAVVLDWMDRHVKGDSTVATGAPVRVYVMGANAWRTGSRWPLQGLRAESLFFAGGGLLSSSPGPRSNAASTSFVADPAVPVRDPFDAAYGAHDLRVLSTRRDVASFETAPLASDVEVIGAMRAELHVSTDARDLDLYVKVLDVAPDGTAYPLMSPGLELQRASYRTGTGPRRLLTPGAVVRMTWNELLTANRFRRGHRLRVVITASYQPHFSLSLQTGASERDSARTAPATIRIWHDATRRSRLVLPVLPVRPSASSAEAAPTLDASPDMAAILDARRRSNAAIAAHDTAGIRHEWTSDVQVVSSLGASLAGADANLAELARRFAARPDVRWVRRATAIEVNDAWHVASERGEWVGTWTDPDGPVEVTGTYQAQWRREDGRWRIRAEVFVPRRCRGGSACAASRPD